ncbi:TVP38/TMEM64 family inner membrane protein ydjZ [Anaerococcus prevotii]|uniref:TVP38/TMEM64 family membrane protein n=1 Tax=Anaerococcus prevotii (strain ATCC 9321 / DSM 20548 / JCM 6508 / NCTC 11806 / PC1) TaxID=525919 RepID=C7RDF7_ANAPD|nr:TVP38/TMEM64 family protein [Anaerococcus prevotii]ACV29220.1 SNARE associated Golgi protein [Anaerococcus prevotii DSM 20548]SUU94895.1 TVP38/TMEM64 family inner membrane protein ydjZ [Anaerococcus prevotii]
MKAIIKKNIFNIISVLMLVIFTILGYLGYRAGLFNSLDSFRTYILSKGKLAPLFFMLIQVVQIVLPVIPGGLTTVFGVIIFGAFWGFIYNYISICIGSILVFFISRNFGKSIVIRIFGKDTFEKYHHKINDKSYEKFFALAILFPVAPDDFLCYLSGLTDMSFKKFASIIFLFKGPSIFLYSMAWVMGLDFIFERYL